jgi:hypothetical protein
VNRSQRCVSTAGLDGKTLREYIRNQEQLERHEQGNPNFDDEIDL